MRAHCYSFIFERGIWKPVGSTVWEKGYLSWKTWQSVKADILSGVLNFLVWLCYLFFGPFFNFKKSLAFY